MGGGLFGSAAPAAGGLFGQQPAQQQLQIQPQAQPSLFGSTGSSFLGGSYNPAQSTSVQGPQMYAMADDPNAYGANPLFANTSPRAPPPVSDKKEPAFKPFRSTGFNRSTSKLTRLRGFAPPVSATPPRASPLNFGASLGGAPGSNGRGSPLRLVNGIGDESALSPNAFVVRPSLKKLFIERRSASDSPGRIHSKDGSPVVEGGAPPRAKDAPAFSKSKVSFNPELEIPTRDRLAAVPTPHPGRPAEMEYPESSTPVKKSAGSSANLGEDSLDIDPSHLPTPLPRRSTPTPRVLKHGDYFTSPTLEVLQKLPSDSLRAVPNLIVGRIGYGQVEFQEPVDLTSIASVEDLLGGIVVLQDRNCTVYPSDYEGKPEGGYGLNVPAVITLERCWPLDKATREPIRDPTHPRLVQHIKRLRKLEDTEFVDFEAEEGRWVFSVAGF
jgi:nuclear pore complex protein Nup98-Nup96